MALHRGEDGTALASNALAFRIQPAVRRSGADDPTKHTGEPMTIIEASIPFFFLLIGLKLLVARVRGRRYVRLNDSVADLSLGTLSQLADVFVKVVSVGIYAVVQGQLAIQHFLPVPRWADAAPFVSAHGFPGFSVRLVPLASWVAVFLLVDLAYYWEHRQSHLVNVLWAGHVVHHSSEEYNLTVALRQSSLHGLMTWVFFVPLALAGVPVRMFAACYTINLVYQFWIHTRAVGRLWAPLEWVLNTPSHHRVHHGTNPRYLDRNYAGVLIVWDRLFGTFEPEREEVVYGLTKPLASWNPLWANVHVFAGIARDFARSRTWADRWRVLFGHPGWRPAYLVSADTPRSTTSVQTPKPAAQEKYDPPVARAAVAYAVGQFVVTLLASIRILAVSGTLALHQNLALVFYVALTLNDVGALFEGKRWAFALEAARLATSLGIAAVLGATGGVPLPFAVGGAAYAALSLAMLAWARRFADEPQPAVLTPSIG